jgi:hypothetical protein
MSKYRLSPEQYSTIESKINLTGDEDYVVLVQKRHGRAIFAVHVFGRQPMPKEMVQYEETASRVKYRGTRAEVEGSSLMAAQQLYNKLVVRAYDVQVGRTLHDQLDADQAKAVVPMVAKREAIREFLGNVAGLTSLADDEGDDERGGGVVNEDE